MRRAKEGLTRTRVRLPCWLNMVLCAFILAILALVWAPYVKVENTGRFLLTFGSLGLCGFQFFFPVLVATFFMRKGGENRKIRDRMIVVFSFTVFWSVTQAAVWRFLPMEDSLSYISYGIAGYLVFSLIYWAMSGSKYAQL